MGARVLDGVIGGKPGKVGWEAAGKVGWDQVLGGLAPWVSTRVWRCVGVCVHGLGLMGSGVELVDDWPLASGGLKAGGAGSAAGVPFSPPPTLTLRLQDPISSPREEHAYGPHATHAALLSPLRCALALLLCFRGLHEHLQAAARALPPAARLAE